MTATSFSILENKQSIFSWFSYKKKHVSLYEATFMVLFYYFFGIDHGVRRWQLINAIITVQVKETVNGQLWQEPTHEIINIKYSLSISPFEIQCVE